MKRVLRSTAIIVAAFGVANSGFAYAADTKRPSESADADEAEFLRLDRAPRSYARMLGTLGFGRGFRFNNPYRLETQLGDSAESLSLTAPYFDLGLGLSFGAPNDLQHGGGFHYSAALEGVGQQVLIPNYLAYWHGPYPISLTGRVGLPIVLTPDINVGGEVAVGVAGFLSGSLGLFFDVVGDLFYGAATPEKSVTTIPVLSAQAGLIIDFEVLP